MTDNSQPSVLAHGAPQEDFSFMGKKMDVSFMPKQIADTSSESDRANQRLSIFSTSSGISTKRLHLTTEELEIQAILRKREQKAQEKRQA